MRATISRGLAPEQAPRVGAPTELATPHSEQDCDSDDKNQQPLFGFGNTADHHVMRRGERFLARFNLSLEAILLFFCLFQRAALIVVDQNNQRRIGADLTVRFGDGVQAIECPRLAVIDLAQQRQDQRARGQRMERIVCL